MTDNFGKEDRNLLIENAVHLKHVRSDIREFKDDFKKFKDEDFKDLEDKVDDNTYHRKWLYGVGATMTLLFTFIAIVLTR